MNEVTLTGVKPTGTVHLGNYVGALRPLFEEARKSAAYALIADLHALNYERNPKLLREQTLQVAALLIAGDKNNNLKIYRSSRVPEISQIATIISNYTPKGYLNRAHAYGVARKNNEDHERAPDHDINMGLYLYPLLMAADMFAVGATDVPVGHDQTQHVEIAQEIARAGNHLFGKGTLTYPTPRIVRSQTVLGTDGRKMSKSYDNVIPLIGPQRSKAIKSFVTSPRAMEDPADPDTCNLFHLHMLFATAEESAALRRRYIAGGFGYGHVKDEIIQLVNRELSDFENAYNSILLEDGSLDEDFIFSRMESDESSVRAHAQSHLMRLQDRIGL